MKKDWLYWTPRILSIMFILFLAMFSLDIFGNGYTWWEIIIGLFMHNIPVFILTILLILAWKREIIGAVAFYFGGLLYIGTMIYNALQYPSEWYMLSYSLIIAGPAFILGTLFLINWLRRKSITPTTRKSSIRK
jgi:hypothetical protein